MAPKKVQFNKAALKRKILAWKKLQESIAEYNAKTRKLEKVYMAPLKRLMDEYNKLTIYY